MGEVRTAIQLYNGMTPALQSISNALNMTISHFEQLQRTSQNSMDTRALVAARQELRNAEANIVEMEEALRGVTRTGAETERSFDRVGMGARNAGLSAREMSRIMQNAMGGMAENVAQIMQTMQQQSSLAENSVNRLEQSILEMVRATQQQTSQIGDISEILNRMGERSDRQNQNQRRGVDLLRRTWQRVTTTIQNVIQNNARLNAIVQRVTIPSRNILNTFRLMTAPVRIVASLWEDVRQKIASVNGGANSLLGTLKGIAATYLSVKGIGFIGNLSDEITSVNARLALMNDGLRTTQALSDTISKLSFDSGADYTDTASAIAKMGLNAGSAFQNNNELLGFMEQINKTFAIGGASSEEQSNAMIQLTQAMAAGALRGEELNSILDGAPGIARNIEKYMGWTEGSIKTYAEDGKVTAQVVKNAMLAMAEETNEKFNSMPTTISRTFSKIKTLAVKSFTPVLQGINSLFNNENANTILYRWGAAFQYIADRAMVTVEKLKTLLNSDKFVAFSDDIVTAFSAAGAVVTLIFDTMANAFSYVVDNWEELQPVLTGFAVAIGVVTAAQWAMNIAMFANPVTLIMVAIGGLIVLFYRLVDRINKTKNTSISATGIIGGAFAGLFAVIKNVVVSVWNAVAYVINSVYNFSKDPIAAIKVLFLDLLDSIFSVIESIVGAVKSATDHLPHIPIVTDVVDNLDGWLTKTRDKIEDTSQKIKLEAGFEDVVPMLKYTNIGEMMTYAYHKLAGFDDGVKEWLEDFDPFKGVDDMNDLLEELIKNAQNMSKDTSKIAGELQRDKEDLEFLRTSANIKYGDKYVMPQVKIEMINNNKINSEIDLDNFFDRKVEEIGKIITTSAEGVHI